MTATVLTPVPAETTRLSPGSRRGLALVALAGPLCMAGWALSSPSDVGATIPEAAAAIAAQPDRAAVSLLLVFLACLFGAAGSLVVAAAVRRGAPRFGAVAGAIAFVGFVAASYPGPVAAIAASSAAGLDADQVLGLIAVVDAQPLGVVSSALFVGVPAGILLLGIAAALAARRGRLPWVVAILLLISTPVITVGGLTAQAALAFGWVVTAVAYAAAGWVYATQPD